MDAFISCVGGVSSVIIIFGFFAYLHYLKHKEFITLAEKGLIHQKRSKNGKDTLRWGIVIAAIGTALLIGLVPVAWGNAWPLLLIGLLPTFFGLGLILIYVLTREAKSTPDSDIEAEPAETLDE